MEQDNFKMNVIKRDGKIESVSFDKILARIKSISSDLLNIEIKQLVFKISEQLYDNILTSKIDELTAQQSITMCTIHYEYSILASRIMHSNYHKNTENEFSKVMKNLYENGLLSDKFYDYVLKYGDILDGWIDYKRDLLIDYFGFKTLEKSYLLKVNGVPVERIQHLWMRVALSIHCNEYFDDLSLVKDSYDLLSQKYFIHASPTLFNCGTKFGQLSSCFLLGMEDDSLDGIYSTLTDCAKISKWSGGIGIHVHNIRGKNSKINGTGGLSTGLVPMLQVFNSTARFVNQGGKRNGSIAIYLEPWHSDIDDFLEMKKNHGDEESKARDLFYALWIPDLFMKRVEENKMWSLFSPSDVIGLDNVYGKEFELLYESYELKKVYKKQVKAQELWYNIMKSQIETGVPYICFKDSVNNKSNQSNIGTIKSSNLCAEICEYSDKNETAVCNLASIGLPSFVKNGIFDYELLGKIVETIVLNLNRIIDINYYPTEKTKTSNLRNRPIGIGVQGLADVFLLMDIPFESDDAKIINRKIFETIYYYALKKSNEMAKDIYMNEKKWSNVENQYLGAYETFNGSHLSKGVLQFDLWGGKQSLLMNFNWNELKSEIIKYGARNSLLVALMPTASTSQILGFNECFEPFTSNIYKRGTMAGEFTIYNKYLMKELIDLGIWNLNIKNQIIKNQGSIQNLEMIPKNIRDKYKTVWEISPKFLLDMSIERGPFICQSQSLNIWIDNPEYGILNKILFYGWKNGLKTGLYYLRRKAKHQTQQFTIEPECQMCSA
uniref:ribonucleoside-diphosphate reductase n=1 Tax=viral metagenome TaxID=1070528 RepID=A0A6C0H635_9ZZZZ